MMRTESLILNGPKGKFLAAFWVMREDGTVDHWHYNSDGTVACEFLGDTDPQTLAVFGCRPERRSGQDRRCGIDRRDWTRRRVRSGNQRAGRRTGDDRRKS